MQELRTSQLRGALDAVLELAHVDDLMEFPQRVAQLARRLTPCDHAGYTTVELGTGRATIAADPPDSVFDGGPQAFACFAHQNPLLASLARAGEAPSALRLSDFMTRHELHRTELYDYVYRRIRLEYQLGVPLVSPRRALGRPAELVGLSLARVDRDFTDAELMLVELLRPHISATLERLHEVTLLRATAAASDPDARRWLLLVEHDGMLAWASRSAASELELTVGDTLPRPLLSWLRSASRDGARGTPVPGEATGSRPARRSEWSRPLTIDGISVQARIVLDAYPGLHAMHIRPLRPRPTVAALRTLGLTQRQAEVFQLALVGRTSPAIAAALSLSSRTVEKHMEAVYARLGAANRTEAALIAARTLEP